MLVIRLFRTGKKNQPFFKIVVTEKNKPVRAGRFVEQVGSYNPLTKVKVLKQERIKYWLSVGAKPSVTFHNILVSEKIIEAKKIPVHKKSKKEPTPTQSAEQKPREKSKPESQTEPKLEPETQLPQEPQTEAPLAEEMAPKTEQK